MNLKPNLILWLIFREILDSRWARSMTAVTSSRFRYLWQKIVFSRFATKKLKKFFWFDEQKYFQGRMNRQRRFKRARESEGK